MQLLKNPHARLVFLLIFSVWFGVDIGRLLYEPAPFGGVFGLVGVGLMALGLFLACVGDHRVRKVGGATKPSNTGLQTDDPSCHGPCWRTVRAKLARS